MRAFALHQCVLGSIFGLNIISGLSLNRNNIPTAVTNMTKQRMFACAKQAGLTAGGRGGGAVKSFVSRCGPVLSRFPPHVQIQENRGL